MSSKTSRARHRRFLAAGFFPPELPPCFYSERLAISRNSLMAGFDRIPQKKNQRKQLEPDYYSYHSQKAHINFPRFKNSDRRHSIINPIAFFCISRVLAEHYITLKKLHKRSKISASPSIFDWSGQRTLKRPSFDSRDAFISDANARFEYVVSADISAFYHSIYTHSIPWAIHGKAAAKKNRSDTLIGNLIDRLCRNAQDGQTIGLPVGPDTSRLIAELIATAVDAEIQKEIRSIDGNGVRFVDDFTVGCASQAEGNKVIAIIRKATNMFELDLNSHKTFVASGVSMPAGGWKTFVRSLVPKAPFPAEDIENFTFRVEELSKQLPDVNIQKFAMQNARRAFVACNNWKFVENYLISVYKVNPTTIDMLVELVILRQRVRGDVSLETISAFINARLPLLCDQQKTGEAAWLLFLAIALGLELKGKSVAGFFEEMDSPCAVLIADANAKSLVKGAVKFSTWNKSLTTDSLDSDMWLYAYESTIQNLNASGKSDAFILAHPYFKELHRRKVEFYRSGQGVSAMTDILHRRRLENAASMKIAADLTEDLDAEIDDWEESEDRDEDEDLY